VQEIRKAQEKKKFKPREASRVISKETADTLSLMLVSSVKKGYAKKAGVPGYKIAGKTGTAQIPKTEGRGYGDESIHSFVGFGPVGEHDPVFVMLVKLDKPTAVRFSADSAAPLFGEIAKFLLDYFEIPPGD
jgi:cell division protein FtsI/penicillin-binding protein 2